MSDQLLGWLRQAGATRIHLSGGDNYSASCPFCNPGGKWPGRSFAIQVDTGLYLCYRPECGATGHVRRLLVDLCGMSPDDARSATESMDVWRDVKIDELQIPDWDDRYGNQEESIDYIAESTLGLYKFVPVYMRERGFSRETLRYFEIGYDFSRKRVTFPVRDHRGRLRGISTRATEPHDQPKYLHLGFQKSTLLYGESYSDKDRIVVGEGNADALALHQLVGHKYKAVSTLGARVSRAQVSRLLHYRSVLLAFDNDGPGVEATRSVGDRLEASGHREVKVLDFPDVPNAKDPAEVLEAVTEHDLRVHPRVRRYQRWRAEQYQEE